MHTLSSRGLRLAAVTTLAAALAFSQGTAHADDPGSIPAENPQHFINFNFDIPGNFNEYTYTVKVGTPLATDSIFYAHYVYGAGGTGYYSGIQPHPDGKAGVRFSFFGAGATALHPNCHEGADWEPGVTCGIDDLKYAVGRKYTLTATKTSDAAGVSYTGRIKDVTTGEVRTIGAWRVPRGYTFSNRANAFIEKFDGVRTCADIPAVKVSYTRVKADGKPLTFREYTHKAGNVPGEDIYTCDDVSTYRVTAPAPGSYTVRSRVSTG